VRVAPGRSMGTQHPTCISTFSRDASEEGARGASATTRADHDKVGLCTLDCGDDLRGRVATANADLWVKPGYAGLLGALLREMLVDR
jgi:hypothetical protein